jgi:putative ABC transport system permease protein
MLENISQSMEGILSHKLRSLLTMLGIIIGIASIITIVSTIKGTNEQIKENLIGSGNNVVDVRLFQDGSAIDMQWQSPPENVACMTERTRRALLKLKGVKDAAIYRIRTYSESVYYKNTSFSGKMTGIDESYFGVKGYNIVRGRGITKADNASVRKVAVLDTGASDALFQGEEPIGRTIEISGEPFVVVGIAAKQSTASPKIKNVNDYYMYTDISGGSVFIPIDSWSIPYRYDEPQNAAIKALSTDEMTEAGKEAADYLTSHLVNGEGENGSSVEYRADNLLEQASKLQSLSTAANRQLIWIAGISLLVGGIGVMNIMLVSVTERTREIGLKKALGAKRRRIAAQFLTEAAVLTSLGGLLGVISGIALSNLLARMLSMPSAVSIPACIVAVAFSMLIGVLFGFLPALKASKLNPIDALRYE